MHLFPQQKHEDQYANGFPSSTFSLSILHSKNSPHCLLASAQLPPSVTARLHVQFCSSSSWNYTNYFSILSILSAIPPRLIASSWIRMAQYCPSNKLPPTLTLPSPLHCNNPPAGPSWLSAIPPRTIASIGQTLPHTHLPHCLCQ